MSKQLWFQSGPASTHRGVNDAKLAGAASWWEPRKLAEFRGSGAATVTAASIAGTTVGIEFTNGAVALEWLTEPLSADYTITGTISVLLWGFESTMNDNAAINFVVDKIDGATGAVTQIAKSTRIVELATTNGANNFTVTPTSTACKRGDRLRVRPFIDDIGTAMIVGTSTFSYNRETAGTGGAGDSWITFTEDLTFEGTQQLGVVGSGSASVLGSLAVQQRAAKFTPIGSATLATVANTMGTQVGAPADDVVVEVQTDSGGLPSDTVVGTSITVNVVGDALYTSAVAAPLSAGTPYWLVVRRTGAADNANNYTIETLSAAGFGASNGGSWSATAVAVRFSGPLYYDAPFGSTYYLTDTAETINPGSATEKKALTTRGSGSVTVAASTAAGPTAGIQV